MNVTPVTVVGLGPMGLALAGALLRHGHPTTVWNRSPHKADPLVAEGARRAETVAGAVTAGPVTVVCLKDYATMYSVLDSAGDALAGRVLVNLTSGTPKEAREAARWAEKRGAAYLDGAVMVPPPLVGQSDALFLYSGPRDVFDAHRVTLASMGGPEHLDGDVGLAVLYNTALLGWMYASLNGFLHAAALVGSAGVPAATFAELAVQRFMPLAINAGLAERAADLDEAHFPGDLGTMEMNLNALEHLTRTSEEQGVDSVQPQHLMNLAQRAIADGHGDKNYLAVFEVFRKATRTA